MNRKSDTVPVPIGKGLWRIVVASAKTRELLALIPLVEVHETRVIYPPVCHKTVDAVLVRIKQKREREDV